jgi:hypothetical protein
MLRTWKNYDDENGQKKMGKPRKERLDMVQQTLL